MLPLINDLNGFKSRVNRRLASSGSFYSFLISFSSFLSFSCNAMPRRGSSAFRGVKPNFLKKAFVFFLEIWFNGMGRRSISVIQRKLFSCIEFGFSQQQPFGNKVGEQSSFRLFYFPWMFHFLVPQYKQKEQSSNQVPYIHITGATMQLHVCNNRQS